MKIRFLGAAETVTGSRFLVESDGNRILVDCGLFQGLKKLRLRNWAPFPVDPSSIDAVVLTHAHIDHSGYLPALVKKGFEGKIYCTPATGALCRILLPDSGYLQEEEANNANKYGYSKHKPALPLYTRDDAESCLEYFETVSSEREFHPARGFRIKFRPVGHILGAASVYLSFNDKTVLFTGDIGRPNDPVMRPPADIEETDYLVVESTYGDRKHPRTSPKKVLERAVNYAIKRGGVVLIPSFAVGRAQTIMHLISELTEEGELPKIPVYLDSPMAIDATETFFYFRDQHRLSQEQCRLMCDRITYTRSIEESKAIASHLSPKIIISASGMLTGGRVVHHLKHYLGRRENVVVFAGYQAAGTRGAAMQAGAESVKIHGEYYPVRAKLVTIDALSAHADYLEIINWLSHLKRPPRKTFIVHGEPHSQDAFRRHIKDSLGWQATIPEQGDVVKLD